MLWLDQPDPEIPRALRRLQRRGLEILTVEPGLRVHTKYYPYVSSLDHHEQALVTSDDDIVYPPGWLAELETAAASNPHSVVCHRAHRITLHDGTIAPYATWTPVHSTTPSLLHFGTSVSGQYLPPQLLDRLRQEGTAFLDRAPMADDVWLHRVAVAAGYPTVQTSSHPRHFPFVPGTQASGLYFTNQWGGENDSQVARTYTEADLIALRADR